LSDRLQRLGRIAIDTPIQVSKITPMMMMIRNSKFAVFLRA